MNNLPREKQIEVIAANPREALDYVQKPKRPVLNLRVAYFGQYRQSDTKPFHPQPTSVGCK